MPHKRTRPTPPASPQPRGGARPATPPRGAARQKDGRGEARRRAASSSPNPVGSGAPFPGYDRAHGVASAPRVRGAGVARAPGDGGAPRARRARGDVSPRRGARARALASCAIDARQLEVLKYRSLARGTTKLLERRARRAMAAFRLCVRAASRERRVERELVPKWNRVIRKRLAFKRFAGAVESRRKARVAGERVALAPSCGSPGGSHARGSRRRARAARSGGARRARRRRSRRGGAAARRRNLRRVGVGVDASRDGATPSLDFVRPERAEEALRVTFRGVAPRDDSRIRGGGARRRTGCARDQYARVSVRGERVRRRKIILLHAWRATARERLRLRVAVARARGRWQAARGAQLVRACTSRNAPRNTPSASYSVARSAPGKRRRASGGSPGGSAARGARNRARRAFSAAFVAWARLAAPRMVANAEARVVAAGSESRGGRVASRTARTVPPRRTARR